MCGSVVVVTEREEDTKGLGSRPGFDCGLRSSFFLLETFSKKVKLLGGFNKNGTDRLRYFLGVGAFTRSARFYSFRSQKNKHSNKNKQTKHSRKLPLPLAAS